MNPEVNKIIQAIENTLNVETQIKRRKKNAAFHNKQLFTALITEIEATLARQNILLFNFGVDNTNYDELFFSVIDKLILLKFGKEISEIVYFYLYDRKNPDGTFNEFVGKKGQVYSFENVNELWDAIVKINPNLQK